MINPPLQLTPYGSAWLIKLNAIFQIKTNHMCSMLLFDSKYLVRLLSLVRSKKLFLPITNADYIILSL